jgi:hypothetical protein
MKFCSKCGIKHEGPTGKRRCRRAQLVELEPMEVMVPELDAGEHGDDGNDVRMANLLTIMSRFATRMDQQQEQLSSIQAALMSPAPESGAIPQRCDAEATKRVWARPRGDHAPRVQVPWPQDFIIGQGWTLCSLFKVVSALLTAPTIRL